MQLRTRFAPSPTGELHVGNAFSALLCQQWAEQHSAELLLRIEDIDFKRCRPEFADGLIEDLHWLRLNWQGEIRYQSQHTRTYRDALQTLRKQDLIYPCFCTRRDIQREIEAIGLAPHIADLPDHYPGTCRKLSVDEQLAGIAQGRPFAWRLNAGKALGRSSGLFWLDGAGERHEVEGAMHDAVIGRKDIGLSYHLAVVLDDAAQSISHIIRGDDLLGSTGLHRLLQALLDLPAPVYIHHPLLLDASGERLAKRNHAPSLRQLRTNGCRTDTLRALLLGKVGDRPPVWTDLADTNDERMVETMMNDRTDKNA